MRETSPVRVRRRPHSRSFIRPLLSLIPFALQRRRRLRVTGGGAEGAGMRPIKEEEGDGRGRHDGRGAMPDEGMSSERK